MNQQHPVAIGRWPVATTVASAPAATKQRPPLAKVHGYEPPWVKLGFALSLVANLTIVILMMYRAG